MANTKKPRGAKAAAKKKEAAKAQKQESRSSIVVEENFNKNYGIYEMREITEGNIGMFATEDIPAGTKIWKECPFVEDVDEEEKMMEIFQNMRLLDQATQMEVMNLMKEIKEHIDNSPDGEGYDEDEFPPEARVHLDRLSEILHTIKFRNASEEVQQKWMSLQDAHQKIPADKSAYVGIFGLKSEKGRLLNGGIGESLNFDPEGGRFVVKLEGVNHSIKPANLKTVGGVWRTNAHWAGLCEKLCRVNHSCVHNCTFHEFGGKVSVTADKDIKAGEELTISYIDTDDEELDTESRQEIFKRRFNFTCTCRACKNNESLVIDAYTSGKSFTRGQIMSVKGH